MSLAVDGGSVTITAVATGTAAATDVKWFLGGVEFFTGDNDRTITTADAAGSDSHITTTILVWANVIKATYDGVLLTVGLTLDGADYIRLTHSLELNLTSTESTTKTSTIIRA